MNPFNHDLAAPDTPLVNVQVNGNWVQVPKGLNVVEVARTVGSFIPHYCYHPKLSISGNCRMCLFEMGTPKMGPDRKPIMGADGKNEIAWMPRPQIGCATQVSEGMGIRTDSPLAKECRNGVMEFLLINHPLDCPICDQAGECKLQEYSNDYGRNYSRFVEDKVKKPKNVDIGERIVLDDERCILCSRCVRFSKEVVHDDVLGFVNRGGQSTLTTHPGKRLDNNYSLNTVDICPVGALTSKDFRFKMRVWFLKETASISTWDGTGCNIIIGSRENTVYRITPRENEAVNSCWMPDEARFEFHEFQREDRFTKPLVKMQNEFLPSDWKDALQQAGLKLKKYSGDQIAMIGSARMTNEELYLLGLLAKELNVALIDVLPRPKEADAFLISNDGNPNSTGARVLGISQDGKQLPLIAEQIGSGQVQALIVFGEDPVACGIPISSLEKLGLYIFAGTVPNASTNQADYILPTAAFGEKRGTMINIFGRLQRLGKAVNPPGQACDDWELLRDLRSASTGGNSIHNYEDVFRSMAAEHAPFAGLSWSKIGDLGIALEWGAAVRGQESVTHSAVLS